MPLLIISVTVPTHGELWGREYSQETALPGKVHRIRGFMACVTCGGGVSLRRRVTETVQTAADYYDLGLLAEPKKPGAGRGAGSSATFISQQTAGGVTLTNGLLEASPASTLVGTYSLTLGGSGVLCADMPAHALGRRDVFASMSQNMVALDHPINISAGMPLRVSFAEREVSPFLAPSEYVPSDFRVGEDNARQNVVPLIWQYWGRKSGTRPNYDYSLKIYLDYD